MKKNENRGKVEKIELNVTTKKRKGKRDKKVRCHIWNVCLVFVQSLAELERKQKREKDADEDW